MLRPEVESELIQEIKQCYPEVEKLSAADIIGWALRTLVQQRKEKK